MKLSFIIPCYNGADTLQRSVESVICQNIDDYEILIVNDGSTDNTLEVAKKIAIKHPQVDVLNKPNGGVSSARNLGIDHATGDYIVFLDADDEFDSNFWLAVKPYVDESAELIIFGFDTEEAPSKVRTYHNKIKKDIVVDYLLGRLRIHICSFLTKKDLIVDKAIRFDEGTYFSEDKEFIIRVLLAANRYDYINTNLFHYKYRDNSAMHLQQYTYRKSTSLDATARIYDLVKHDEDRSEAALVQLKLTILLHIRFYKKTHCADLTLWKKLRNYFDLYVTLQTPFRLDKYYLYVWFWGMKMKWR